MSKQYRAHLIVIGLYTLLALFFTWPLAAHLTTHIPGEATWAFDESTFIWNMWWLKFSLLHLRQTPLESTYTFFPLGIRLTTYTFNLFHAAFGLPLQLALSLPLANNLTLLFSYISSAYGTFLLALYLLHQPQSPSPRSRQPAQSARPKYLAAFAAGAVFAFSASRMMYVALGHYNFVTIQWFPFYTLFLLKTVRGGTLKTLLLTGLFAALCLYAELTYSVFLVFITLLILIDAWTRPSNVPKEWPGRFSQLVSLARRIRLFPLVAIGLLTFIFTAPFVLSVLPDFLDPALAESGWGEGLKLSADLVGLFSLTPLHPLSGLDWIRELRAVIEGTSRFNDANTLFLGYGILALAWLGYGVRRKESRVWLWSVIVFTILSLGPLLTINGQNRFDLDGIEVTYPLPFALLHYIPVINANRVPNRFGIPLTMALAVLVGYAITWLNLRIGEWANRRMGEWANERMGESANDKATRNTQSCPERSRRDATRNTPPQARKRHATPSNFSFLILNSLLLCLLLFDQYSVPLPLTDARIPAVYEQIGAEADDFTLMQLPLGWRNSYGTLGAERTQLQYYQAVHHHPMLGGNTSRNSAFKFDYYANIPLFRTLTEAELYRSVDDITLEQARSQATELMTLYNIKYLVIHDPIPYRKPYEDTFTTTRKLALDLIPHRADPVYQSPGVQVLAIEQAPIPDPLILDFGDWRSDPYRGEGWAGNEEIFAATANWATAPDALIFFPTRGRGNRHLAIEMAPFHYPGMPAQTVSLSLNGHPLPDSFSLHEGWQTIELFLPEARLRHGLNRLTLHFAHTAQPRQVLPANRTVGQTGLDTPVDLEVNSGPDFAFITVGFGQEAADASAHRRGVNVAVVQPQSGQVVAIRGFDTAANEFEAAALTEFIAGIPAGQIVVVATQGLEATAFFQAETRLALQSLGLSTDTLMPPFSAIGVKGAPPGTALQTTSNGRGTAYLRLGASPDTRPLAAAVDRMIISSDEFPRVPTTDQ